MRKSKGKGKERVTTKGTGIKYAKERKIVPKKY
jgi:hypothetical protein